MTASIPQVPKLFRDGTHRAAAPQETYARALHFARAMSITRIANVTGLDRVGVPVAMAYRPNARSLVVAPGKGLDLAAAKVSALMESIEGWHAERILAPLLFGSIHELQFTRRLIDVENLPRVAGGDFHSDLRVLWIEGRDLLGDSSSWVPFEVVHTNYTLPLPPCSGGLLLSSNGLASGNHWIEAVSHAICELIERDATTLWHALSSPDRDQSRVDLGSIDDPACCFVLERFARAKVATALWELTGDVGVPAFRCIIVDEDPGLGSHLPGLGAGCHPSREIAMLRALTEAAQTRLTLITGARDDMGVAHYLAARDSALHEKILAEISNVKPTRQMRDAPTFASDTFDDDVRWELDCLSRVGIRQVVAVDLTRPGIGIPVVRVVIPGLEGIHDAPGYIPGDRCHRRTTRA